jgi:hypothetical protein
MNKFIKIWSILIAVTFFVSCGSVGNLSKVKKTLVLPGRPQAKAFVRYSGKLKTNKPVKILKIRLIIDQTAVPAHNISVVNLNDGRIMNLNELLPPGNYFIEVKLMDKSRFVSNNDKLIVKYKLKDNNKIYKFVQDVVDKKVVKSK